MVFSFFDLRPAGVMFGIHSMIAGSLLAIVGYQALHLGVFATIAGTSISKPKDRITTLIVKQVTLERGAVFGLSMLGVGGFYATYLLAQWASSGFTDLPLLKSDIAAFTVIVLGVQTMFYSFFMETIDAPVTSHRLMFLSR